MNDLEKMLKELKFIHDVTEDMVDYVTGANDGPDRIADRVSRELLYLTDSIRIIKDSTKRIMEGDEHE